MIYLLFNQSIVNLQIQFNFNYVGMVHYFVKPITLKVKSATTHLDHPSPQNK